MPPLPVVPNVAKIVHHGALGPHDWQMVHHFAFSGGSMTTGDAALMAAAAHSALATDWIEGSNNAEDCSLLYTTVTDLSTSGGAFAQSTSTHTGGDANPAIAQAAFVVSWQVPTRYRGGHSKTFLPGGTVDAQEDMRTWNASQLAQATTWANAYAAAVAAPAYSVIGGVLHAVVSYYNKELNPVPPYRRAVPVVYLIQGHTYDTVMRSQRRRVRATPTPT
jgi:hypothetical protein